MTRRRGHSGIIGVCGYQYTPKAWRAVLERISIDGADGIDHIECSSTPNITITTTALRHHQTLAIAFRFHCSVAYPSHCYIYTFTILFSSSSHSPSTPLKLRNNIPPPLPTHLPLALCHLLAPSLHPSFSPSLTSVIYPAVPSIAGTNITYANESHAVRFVQRKYLWRLTVISFGGC